MKTKTSTQCPRYPKTDARYWERRLFRTRAATGRPSTTWSIRFRFKRHRLFFSTGLANRTAAARMARQIYLDLLALGVEGALGKYKPEVVAPAPAVATIGMYVERARAHFGGESATFNAYAAALRRIAAAIARHEIDRRRFGRATSAYRKNTDALPLDILTPAAVDRWRIRYVEAARDPAAKARARTTCNGVLRGARALFAPRRLKLVTEGGALVVPDPPPFRDVVFWPRESTTYHSKFSTAELLVAAREELAETDAPAFLAFTLAIGAGLRRAEIDALTWQQIDFQRRRIIIEPTVSGKLKSARSAGAVPIDETLTGVLRGFAARATGAFVIEDTGTDAGAPAARTWGRSYRCDRTFARLIVWLRRHGVEGRTPLHVCRKQAGAEIATRHGVYAASKFLRHGSVAVTTMHYADQLVPTPVDMGALAPPANVVEMPTAAAPSPAPSKRRKTAGRVRQ